MGRNGSQLKMDLHTELMLWDTFEKNLAIISPSVWQVRKTCNMHAHTHTVTLSHSHRLPTRSSWLSQLRARHLTLEGEGRCWCWFHHHTALLWSSNIHRVLSQVSISWHQCPYHCRHHAHTGMVGCRCEEWGCHRIIPITLSQQLHCIDTTKGCSHHQVFTVHPLPLLSIACGCMFSSFLLCVPPLWMPLIAWLPPLILVEVLRGEL